ncbi:MAG: KH domain-containing protein [Patescibacteria group bacterium]
MSDAAYQEFLELLVKGIVNNPDAVKVNRTLDERGVLLTLSVDPKDMGLIIGKQGGTAKAIRTLLRIVGIKNDARVNLKIEEPEGAERPNRTASVDTVDQVVEDLKI